MENEQHNQIARKFGVKECLSLLAYARKTGAWDLPSDLYPHEVAQILSYVLQSMGYRVAIERQLLTVKSDELSAGGADSAMVYNYGIFCTVRGRMGLGGELDLDQTALTAARREYPGAHISESCSWQPMVLPRLAEYHGIGRQYRLTPQEAMEQVAHGVAALEAAMLDHSTSAAPALPKRRI